jgi:hypothetical protein
VTDIGALYDSRNSVLLPQSDLLYLLIIGADGYSYADHAQ